MMRAGPRGQSATLYQNSNLNEMSRGHGRFSGLRSANQLALAGE